MRALGDYLNVKVHACVGGTSVREDQRILQAGVHVVVGTPGRVFDMLRRQSLRPDYIKMFVLDEADEMLSRGFKDQVGKFNLILILLYVCNAYAPYIICLTSIFFFVGWVLACVRCLFCNILFLMNNIWEGSKMYHSKKLNIVAVLP